MELIRPSRPFLYVGNFELSPEYLDDWPGAVALVVGGSSDIRRARKKLKAPLREIEVQIYKYHSSMLMEGRQPQGRFLLLITEALFNWRWSAIRWSADVVFDTCGCHRMRQHIVEGYGWCDILSTVPITIEMKRIRRDSCECYIPITTNLQHSNGEEMSSNDKHRKVPHPFIGLYLPDVKPNPDRIRQLLKVHLVDAMDFGIRDSKYAYDSLSFNDYVLGELLRKSLRPGLSEYRCLALVLVVCAVRVTASQRLQAIFQSRRHLLHERAEVQRLVATSSFIRAFLSANGTTSVEVGLALLALQQRIPGTSEADLKNVGNFRYSDLLGLMPGIISNAVTNLMREAMSLMHHFLSHMLQSLRGWPYKAHDAVVPSENTATEAGLTDGDLAKFLETEIRGVCLAGRLNSEAPTRFIYDVNPVLGMCGFVCKPSPIAKGDGQSLKIKGYTDDMDNVFRQYGCRPLAVQNGKADFDASGSRQRDMYLLLPCLDIYLQMQKHEDEVDSESEDELDSKGELFGYQIDFVDGHVHGNQKVLFAADPLWVLNPFTNPSSRQVAHNPSGDHDPGKRYAVCVLGRHMIPDTIFINSAVLVSVPAIDVPRFCTTAPADLADMATRVHSLPDPFFQPDPWCSSSSGVPALAKDMSTECVEFQQAWQEWSAYGWRFSQTDALREHAALGHSEKGSHDDVANACQRMVSALQSLQNPSNLVTPINQWRLMRIHRDIMGGTMQGLRRVNVRIGNTHFVRHHDLPPLWLMFWKTFDNVMRRGDLTAVAKAAWAMHGLVSLHPFRDGNGRCARWLGAWVLRRNEFPLVPFMRQPAHRKEFIQAVRLASATGETARLANHILKCAHETLSSLINDTPLLIDWNDNGRSERFSDASPTPSATSMGSTTPASIADESTETATESSTTTSIADESTTTESSVLSD